VTGEQKKAVFLGAAFGLLLSGGYLLARRFAARVQPHIIDWQRTERIAYRIAARSPEGVLPAQAREALRADYQSLVRLSHDHIVPFIQIPAASDHHEIEVLDRPLWVERNLDTVKNLLLPLEDVYQETVSAKSNTMFRLAHGSMQLTLSAQMGLVLGFLSRNVLGQFDMPFLTSPQTEAPNTDISPNRIYFVEPNIRRLQQRLEIPVEAFRLWIALHETTHAIQFQVAPWLAGYLADLIESYVYSFREMLQESDHPLRAMLLPGAETSDNRDQLGGLMGLLTTPEQRDMLVRVQGVMSLVEGHGNYVMDELGEQLIDGFPAMRQRLEQRKRGSLERAIMRLLGFDLKLAQYRLGERFVRHVATNEGMTLFNRVWESEHTVPTLDEINAPEQWVDRMKGSVGTPANQPFPQ
jgi:coenzyme F420 biosynthesis associated uncharacterized protein